MEVLNKESFKSKIFNFETNNEWKFAGELPTIVDFYADWCGPCKALSPVLEQVAKDYQGKVNIYKVNTESDPELAALFSVRGIPALLFIPKSGMPTMSAGFMPQEKLQKAIKDIFGV